MLTLYNGNTDTIFRCILVSNIGLSCETIHFYIFEFVKYSMSAFTFNYACKGESAYAVLNKFEIIKINILPP